MLLGLNGVCISKGTDKTGDRHMRHTGMAGFLSILFFSSVMTDSAQPQQPCRPKQAADKPTITFRVGGGPTGTVREWLIFNTGLICMGSGSDPIYLRPPDHGSPVGERWTYSEKGRISPDKIDRLIGTITKLGFFNLERGYYGLGTCHQCNRYRIRLRKGSKE